MSLPNELLPVGLLGTGEAAAEGYSIERSVRFNSSDSAYLSRTPASTGNRKTWTWSNWCKKAKNDTELFLLSSDVSGSNNRDAIRFESSNEFRVFFNGTAGGDFVTDQVFRDPSAWYHIVVAVDTTQATASNRVKIYVNGSQVTSFSTETYPALNYDTGTFVSGKTAYICRDWSGNYFDGYVADVHFIDGQALDPTSFGEFDDNGIWQPIEYTGTYGTNGFHLDFSDNSTAAALGTDTSGNSNTWTVNNISVTAGAGNDSLVDVPTNGTETDTGVGGEVRGNYATWNPLSSGSTSLANGNLQTSSPSGEPKALATIAFPVSGKWYFEVTITQLLTSGADYGGYIGIESVTSSTTNAIAALSTASGVGGVYKNDVRLQTITSLAVNDVIGIAFDADSLTCQFYRNGSTYGSQVTGLTSATYIARLVSNNAGGATNIQQTNFGQRPFAYTAPSGYKCLCTANLPAPVVTKPSEVMDVALYTGNGSTQTISGLDFSPDFVWLKKRSGAADHYLYDQVRGATYRIYSNQTDAESTSATGLSAFTSDGFTVGSASDLNQGSNTYVAWNWDAGSSTATNTDGSITSQVRANASAGFSIVTWTTSGSTGDYISVGHGLNALPGLVITKSRSNVDGWYTAHGFDLTQFGTLNTTNAFTSASVAWGDGITSSVIGMRVGNFTANGYTHVAYCFAPVDGYSSFGSFTANANTDGPFVYLGFRPALVVCKKSSGTGSWFVLDSARDPFNVTTNFLEWQDADAEASTQDRLDFVSNGFKVRTPSGYTPNESNGDVYVYMAWAEHPFALNARAR